MQSGEVVACLVLLDPTQREGRGAARPVHRVPRTVRRAASLGRFVWDRIALYRQELDKLEGAARLDFVAAKLARAASRVLAPGEADVRRELRAREVYRGNLDALDSYRRRPLDGDLRLIVVIETPGAHAFRARRWNDDWLRLWRGEVASHVVTGRDSGDMLAGPNARAVGALVVRHLDAAFATRAGPPSQADRRAS
jgi:thioesterase domain-containing protein